MGGHDHHHGPEVPEVPDWTKYKVESSEYLMEIQRKLGEKGLRDPWLRNHVWRTDMHKAMKYPDAPLFKLFTYGWKVWVPLLIGTIAIENFLGIDYHAHGTGRYVRIGREGQGHGHGHEHGDEH